MDNMTLEEGFSKVEEMIAKLQEEELPLEQSFALYKEGMELLKNCTEKIDYVEKQVKIMSGEGELDDFS